MNNKWVFERSSHTDRLDAASLLQVTNGNRLFGLFQLTDPKSIELLIARVSGQLDSIPAPLFKRGANRERLLAAARVAFQFLPHV